MRGRASYFKHAVGKHTLGALENSAWHRVIRWWKPCTAGTGRMSAVTSPVRTAGGAGRQRTGSSCSSSRRCRSSGIATEEQNPQPLATRQPHLRADAVKSPLPGDRHGEFGERPGETDREQSRHRAPGRLTTRVRHCGLNCRRRCRGCCATAGMSCPLRGISQSPRACADGSLRHNGTAAWPQACGSCSRSQSRNAPSGFVSGGSGSKCMMSLRI
jgi:hypothetical protein